MSSVRIDQKSYQMPPRDGFTVTHISSPSPTSTGRLILMKRSSAAAF